MLRCRPSTARPVLLCVWASPQRLGLSWGRAVRMFRRLSVEENRIISRETDVDEQRWTEFCVTVTGCTPQAFLSLAPLDGLVDDHDHDHEDDGHPCLKRRAIPSHCLDTSPGGFLPFHLCLLFPLCHLSTTTFLLNGRDHSPRFCLQFCVCCCINPADTVLFPSSRLIVHGCSRCTRLASSITFASYGFPYDR